jgi:CubicO group peptidase (beta-lactamase class C family)
MTLRGGRKEERPVSRETETIRRSNTLRYLAVLLLLAAVVATTCDRPGQTGVAYEAPELLDDGWEVASPVAEGLDAGTVQRVAKQIADGEFNYVHSFLVAQNGKLVLEQYYRGQHRDMTHRLYSVTKSVTSALVGIAIDLGYIGGVEETVISYFSEYVGEDWDHDKDAITLQHMLMMASGLEYDENSYPYGDERNSYTRMTATDDWIKWGLEQPLVAKPGSAFAYSSANTHTFAGIIHKTTGLHADEFAEEHLFGPLGVDQYLWYAGDGHPTVSGAHGGLKLRPRDMAKFGQMYLDGGRWKGQQVVPEDWVRESFVPRIDSSWGTRYGYQWWIQEDRILGRDVEWISARGYGEQYIALFPSLEMMVVVTCGNETSWAGVIEAILAMAEAALRGQ